MYRDLSIDGRIHIQSTSPSVQLEYFNGINWILMGGGGELVSLFEVERPILGTVDMTNILFRVAASTPAPSSATPFSLLVQHFTGDAATLAVTNFVPAGTPSGTPSGTNSNQTTLSFRRILYSRDDEFVAYAEWVDTVMDDGYWAGVSSTWG